MRFLQSCQDTSGTQYNRFSQKPLQCLGLSPLLKRDYRDRLDITPCDTTNIALVGQYAELVDETALSMEYGVRCAQLAVRRVMGWNSERCEVKSSFLVAQYGTRARGNSIS